MKAVLNGTVIAEAPKEDLISIDGNWYFPPSSVKSELLEKSPTPHASAFDRVGEDFSNYVVFWKEVQVTE